MNRYPRRRLRLCRDTERGIEVYLSRRPAHFRYYPGAFVFPGGRVDREDTDIRATARREVLEEIGIEIDTERLVPLRNIHTSAHAGPVYHMLTFAYPVEEEFHHHPERSKKSKRKYGSMPAKRSRGWTFRIR